MNTNTDDSDNENANSNKNNVNPDNVNMNSNIYEITTDVITDSSYNSVAASYKAKEDNS